MSRCEGDQVCRIEGADIIDMFIRVRIRISAKLSNFGLLATVEAEYFSRNVFIFELEIGIYSSKSNTRLMLVAGFWANISVAAALALLDIAMTIHFFVVKIYIQV